VSALGYGSTDDATFRSFWPANAHIVGKDIARFHAIIWPAMLLSAGLPLPQKLWIHGFITSGGVKMSKSIGNVIDPKEYLNEYGVDAFRYYLGREISPFEDGDFTKERFEETYNANLANGLGNLLSRTIKMATQYFDGTVSRGLSEDLPLPVKRDGMTGEHKVTGYTIRYVIANELFPAYHEHMRNFQLQGAADVIWELIGLLDGYIATYEPYKLIKTDTEKTENCIYNVLVGIDAVREMIGPFMPHTAEAIHEVITHEGKGGTDMAFSVQPLEAPLFARI
jgi:methionyl-tRNA synthetase